MRCTTVWPALFLPGLGSAAFPQDVNSTLATDFASATAQAFLTAEAASWKEAPAAVTIWAQVGSLYGSAVISLFSKTTPHAHTIDSSALSSSVHGLTHRKTVSTASCETSFNYTKAASAAVPTRTSRGAIATGSYRFVNPTGDAPANQPEFANLTVNVTASNTTTFNATTINPTTNPLFRGPFPTQLPTGISLFSNRGVPTQNSVGQLLVAALLQVAFALLL
jgi:hypothetical protein